MAIGLGAALLGGSALGLAGSLFGGSAANSQAKAEIAAAERSRQQTLDAILGGNSRAATFLHGYNPQALKYLQQNLSSADYQRLVGTPSTSGTPLTPAEQQRREQLMSEIAAANNQTTVQRLRAQRGSGGRVTTAGANPGLERLKAELAMLDEKAGGKPGTAGLVDRSIFEGDQPGVLDMLNRFAGDAQTQGNANLQGFDRETGRIMSDYAALENEARKGGQAQKDLVEQQGTQAITGANRRSAAALAARGLGNSSIVGNQIGANERDIGRDMTAAKVGIDRGIQDRLLGLGQTRIGALMGRNSQRTGVQLAGQDVVRSLQMQVPQLMERVTLGAPMNAATGVNYSQFNPGVSTSAGTSQALGNFLASQGGLLAGLGAMNMLNTPGSGPGGGTPGIWNRMPGSTYSAY